jgi:hypothetical protein
MLSLFLSSLSSLNSSLARLSGKRLILEIIDQDQVRITERIDPMTLGFITDKHHLAVHVEELDHSTEVPRMVRHIDRQRLQTIGQQIDDSFR